MMDEKKQKNLVGWLFIGLIIVMLCVPSLRLYRPIRLSIRRLIAQQQSFLGLRHVWAPSWCEAKQRIAADFEFHDVLRKWFSKTMFFGLGATTSQDVQKAPNGWLFYTTQEERRCMHHTHPFSDKDLVSWGNSLDSWRLRLADKGIDFLLVVAPDKHTIYDELAPVRNHYDTPSRMDQLYAYLRENTSINAVDVRQALVLAKDWQQLYYKTDTHWNDAGAFVAFEEMVKGLKEKFPKIRVDTRDAYEQKHMESMPLDLARIAGVDDVLLEPKYVMYPKVPIDLNIAVAGLGVDGDASRLTPRINSSSPTGVVPRILMLRDSFGTALLPFVAAIAQEGCFLWAGQLDWSLVEKEMPSLVIFEIVERHLQLEWMRPLPV